ncbi:MAG: hypothetical protein AB7P69_15835 [Candidatus Binatia bacterium]
MDEMTSTLLARLTALEIACAAMLQFVSEDAKDAATSALMAWEEVADRLSTRSKDPAAARDLNEKGNQARRLREMIRNPPPPHTPITT